LISVANREYIVLGAGGHGAVVADILHQCGCSVMGFLDDGVTVGTEVLGLKVLGKIERCADYPKCLFIIGIGANATRKRIALSYPVEYGTAIHPSAIMGQGVEVGCGSVVMAGSVVNPRTVIGAHCVVNTSVSLDHDNRLGDFVHISPGSVFGGDVSIGNGSHVGLGTIVRNGISICHDVVVGAGAVVVKNIDAPGVYIGIPARLKH